MFTLYRYVWPKKVCLEQPTKPDGGHQDDPFKCLWNSIQDYKISTGNDGPSAWKKRPWVSHRYNSLTLNIIGPIWHIIQFLVRFLLLFGVLDIGNYLYLYFMDHLGKFIPIMNLQYVILTNYENRSNQFNININNVGKTWSKQSHFCWHVLFEVTTFWANHHSITYFLQINAYWHYSKC
jgi:hypothetical protein